MKLVTLQNNIQGEIKRTRVELEKLIDSKGYEVKMYADYDLSIKDNELEASIKLKALDFQNEGEDDEIITQVKLNIDSYNIIDKEEVAGKIIELIENAR